MEHLYLQIKHFQDNTIGKETAMDIYIQMIAIINNLIIKIINLMAKLNILIKLEIIHSVVPIMEVPLIINKMDPKLIKINLILMITIMVMLL